ncbi:PHP domain-containing protein [Oceanirhabdus seepicola]|uniref:Histidinol-phosphatase n=1 Tax=Oceanirhabdus seepicola TaxID=2828781 RepID=A0A9J6P4L6_9CLOT|nr:PHP domain-containing protein [Oceanirhabdus seepicola]MCM1991523.1 histidinol phosphate phosphatase [Oceanirhabdus seepicola]
MLDAHVHIERGSYTEEWISEFIKSAVNMGIKELYLLEHSHRFIQFKEIYQSIKLDQNCGVYQTQWIERKCKIDIEEYKKFILEMRKKEFPIKLKFGLEVCYFIDKEDEIRELVSDFDWDFLTGSIHWIDGWGFDHPATIDTWERKKVDEVYLRYYELMIKLVESKLFNILAHPDSIKCFDFYPKIDLSNLYKKLALALKDNNMLAEFSCGLYNNYNHEELGLNAQLLSSLISNGVKLITASDAHKPEDVGRNIRKSYEVCNL